MLSQDALPIRKKSVIDFVEGLKKRQVPFNRIFSFNIANEIFLAIKEGPLSINTGKCTGVNGITYNMNNPDEKKKMIEDGVVFWINEMTKTFKSIAPNTLVSAGQIAPYDHKGWGREDMRTMDVGRIFLDVDQGGTIADYVDIHMYAGNKSQKIGSSVDETLRAFNIKSYKKPILSGELGVFRNQYSRNESITVLMSLINRISTTHHFDGWLFWTWNTSDQPELYTMKDNDWELAERLSPNKYVDKEKPINNIKPTKGKQVIQAPYKFSPSRQKTPTLYKYRRDVERWE